MCVCVCVCVCVRVYIYIYIYIYIHTQLAVPFLGIGELGGGLGCHQLKGLQ